MELSPPINMPTTGPDRESQDGRGAKVMSEKLGETDRMADELPVLRSYVEVQPAWAG